MKVKQHIKEFLLLNESVIIPDFGQLKSKYESAEIDTKRSTIMPPKKVISFDSTVRVDDGALVNYISVQESITKTEAKDLIFKFVTETFVSTEQGGKVTIDEVGIFSNDKKKNLIFEPFENANLLDEAYGLQDVKLQTTDSTAKKIILSTATATETKVTKKTTLKTTESTAKIEKKSNSKLYIILGVAALLVIGLVFWSYKTGLFDNAKTYVADLTDFKKSDTQTEKIPVEANETGDNIDVNTEVTKQDTEVEETGTSESENIEKNKLETEKQAAVAEKTDQEEEKYVEPRVKADSKKTFHIIVGSYSAYEAAQKVAAKYKTQGYNSEVLEKENDVYRVTLGSYKYKEEALKNLEQFKKTESGIWILSR